MKKFWVSIEDTSTCEVSEFEKATEKEVLYLMDGYRVNMSNPTKFRVTEMENGRHVVYKGVTYRGGFGYNLWVARKFLEL